MFMKLGEMIDVDSAMNPQHFWTDRQTSGSDPGLMRQSEFETRNTFA